MKLSAVRLVAATGLVASTLAGVALTSASPASAEPLDWCSSGAPTPCIESLTRGSTSILKTDPAWQAEIDVFNNESPDFTQIVWSLRKSGNLDVTSTESGVRWTIVIDTGSVVPRVSNAFGRHGTVTRVTTVTAPTTSR